ncbi:MAG: hypothetical protein S4CHLAM6_12040 [Chlamydiae bacterium]|nr:hypothetical protein [Chlamydiota bacterium]
MALNINFLEAQSSSTCNLCQENVLKSQKFYEDEHVSILYDYKPIIRGHCLVIPKRHVEHLQDLTDQEMLSAHKAIGELFKASQRAYEATSYLILQKNGKDAGQSVPHVHFHFFPRKEGDYSDIGILARFYLSGFKAPIAQDQIDLERNLLAQEIYGSNAAEFQEAQ